MNKVIKDRLQGIKCFSKDDQVTMASAEDELQRIVCTLENVIIKYNLKISVNKKKAMAMKGKMNVSTKIVVGSDIIEQVVSCNYGRYTTAVRKTTDF
jgi:hypothetical protein